MKTFWFALVIAGCSAAPEKKQTQLQAQSDSPKAEATAQPAARGAGVFTTRCAACHGASGKGDGAAAAALNPKPRDFSDKAWQASVTDEHIRRAMLEGGAAVGKSPLMAANPDLKDQADEIVKFVRSLARE